MWSRTWQWFEELRSREKTFRYLQAKRCHTVSALSLLANLPMRLSFSATDAVARISAL